MISKKGRYLSHETWDEIRLKNPTVDWWKVIWFPLAIPKHSLIMWLATKNCLTTGDRLIKWGYKGAVVCFFVGVKWRLESISFLNVASAPESGEKVLQDAEFLNLMLFIMLCRNGGKSP
jgi:hypothetical protein